MISGRAPDGGGIRVTVEGDVIVEVASTATPGPDSPWILPGLVDLQVNGYGGHDANGDVVDADAIVAMARALAHQGTTTFIPTIITASPSAIARSLRAVAKARELDPVLRVSVPYAHVEGPHISEFDGPRGAHDAAHIRPPSLAEFDQWQEVSGGLVGMVTMSPHWPGSAEYISGLVARGVRVAIGHTHATPDQLRAAVDAGAAFSTHLGNGIFATLPRHPNGIWAQLADDRLSAGFIADGHHLPDDTLKAMLRAKGVDRSFVVSDAVAIAGSEPGRYRTPVGGEVELDEGGRLSVAGTDYLAGAALCLRAALGTLIRCGFTLSQAVQLTAGNPGRVAGQGGRLAVGDRADVLSVRFVNGAAEVVGVWQAGEQVVKSICVV